MSRFRRLCVYCGSSNGVRPIYLAVAQALGAELVRRGIGLVYGGGSLGMMGAVARAVLERGGEVVGIIPAPLAPKEISGPPLGELEVVDSMHARKARMAELADGFIALPGGFGTLEELFETITWAQLGIHNKPIGLLNPAGYFDPLCRLVDHAVEQGFIRPEYRDLWVVDREPGRLLDRLEAHRPPEPAVRWIRPEEI